MGGLTPRRCPPFRCLKSIIARKLDHYSDSTRTRRKVIGEAAEDVETERKRQLNDIPDPMTSSFSCNRPTGGKCVRGHLCNHSLEGMKP